MKLASEGLAQWIQVVTAASEAVVAASASGVRPAGVGQTLWKKLLTASLEEGPGKMLLLGYHSCC